MPGDAVLADRGFGIEDSLATVMAHLIVQAFTIGKTQLAAVDIEKTRKIVNSGIHGERVIGSIMQKYTFLDSVLPVDHLIAPEGDISRLDKEVVVCCALVNLNDSVVPFH